MARACAHLCPALSCCPTSAEEHVRAYLAEVMEHFWAERAEGFADGQVPPLGECVEPGPLRRLRRLRWPVPVVQAMVGAAHGGLLPGRAL